MKNKTRAQRGLRRVSQNVFCQVDIKRHTAAQAIRQDYLAAHFRLTPAMATVVVELAFTDKDIRGAAR